MLFCHWLLSRDEAVDFRQDVLEGRLHIRRIQRGSFDEGTIIFLRKRFGFVRRHSSEVPQIGLVPDEHDHDVLICED